MKKVFILSFLLISVTISAFAQRSNCGSSPYPLTIDQPDGSSVTYRITGNELIHYYQTLDGYTILKNSNGVFEYAIADNSGDMVLSGIKAQSQTPTSFYKNQTIVPGFKYSKRQIDAIIAANPDFYANTDLGKAASGSFPSLGKNKMLVLLIQFPDEPAIYAKANFDSLMMQTNYNGTGCFNDVYKANSFGKFELDAKAHGWFTASLPRASYGKTNNDGTPNPNYMTRVKQLITEAINQADAEGVDFSQYDNNKDGKLDGLVVFQSGFGAEQGLDGYVWSHRSSITAVVKDGVSISSYCINPAKRKWNNMTEMVGIGVVSHEFGHILGLPDLYDTNDNSEGAGNWSLMAGGPWLNSEKTPAQHDPWCKTELGWLNTTQISSNGTYVLSPSVDSNRVYRINTPLSSEYFLLENKQQKRWDKFLPGKGLIIWHINTNKTNLWPSSNTVNTDTARFGVGVMQADGLRHLEKKVNRGDAGDPFPGTTSNKNFTPFTNPSSALHPNGQGVRTMSNVSITNITINPDSSITFNFGNKASAAFSPSAISGCAPLIVNFVNNSAFIDNFEWSFGDGTTATTKNATKVYTSSGSYEVKLVIIDSVGTRVDSATQTINVLVSPKSSFELTRGDSNTFYLSNKSTDAGYIVWRFGTNQTSTAANPTYKIIGTESIPFYLVAYTFSGCTDTSWGELSYWPVGIAEEMQNISSLKSYPNPFKNSLSVSFNALKNENIRIRLFDLTGQLISEFFNGRAQSGLNEFEFSTNNLKPTFYMLNIDGESGSKTLKVFKTD